MSQSRTGKLKLRQILPDRFSQIIALFLAFYLLFLMTPAIDVGLRERNGFELSGWASILVIIFGVLCAGVHRGTWYRRYWQIPKMAFMFSFVFASEDVVVQTIMLFIMRRDPYRFGMRLEDGFGYGMPFYWFSLAFFFVFLFLMPKLSPGDQVASSDQDRARGSGDSAAK